MFHILGSVRTTTLVLAISGCAPRSAAPPGQAAAREGTLVTVDGVRLYYRVIGSGETVIAPLALYHTTSLDSLATNHRLVLYDPRGRGRSDTVPASKVSLEHNLRDLDAIRAEVGADQVDRPGDRVAVRLVEVSTSRRRGSPPWW